MLAVLAFAMLAQLVFNVALLARVQRAERRPRRKKVAPAEATHRPLTDLHAPFQLQPREEPEEKRPVTKLRFERPPYSDPESRADEMDAFREDLKLERYGRN